MSMSARHSPVRRLSDSIESKDDLNLPIEKGNFSILKVIIYFFNSFNSFSEESIRSARGSRAQSLEDVKNVDKGTVNRSGRKYSDNLYRQCLGMSNFVCSEVPALRAFCMSKWRLMQNFRSFIVRIVCLSV